jgi:hypothetical protein
MGEVLQFDKEMATIFKQVRDLEGKRVFGIAVVVINDEDTEEFWFCGDPVKIFRAVALAQAHILQNFSLMCNCPDKLVEEEE